MNYYREFKDLEEMRSRFVDKKDIIGIVGCWFLFHTLRFIRWLDINTPEDKGY